MLRSDSTIPKIDLRSVRDALILRWWIIPLSMLLSVGFLFANESDLQTTPGHVTIIRLYEARDESAVMAVAGIDPASIVPYPSFDSQLVVLQSPQTRQKIADRINADTTVTVTRTEQTFSLLDTIVGDGKKRFTFLSAGIPSYSFVCSAPTANECDIVLDAYVEEISQLRAMSIQQGYERAEIIVQALIDNSPSDSQSLRNEQQALGTGKKLVTGEMALLTSTSENIGPTVGTVKKSTYGFGLGVGALLGLLVVLQLTVTDRKIRSVRRLVALVGAKNSLGTLRSDRQDSSSQHVAAGLVHQSAVHHAAKVRLIPIDDRNIDAAAASLNQALSEHSIEVTAMKNVDHLTTLELLPPDDSIVALVAESGTSRTDNLERVWAIAEHAGNTVVGVVLVQS